jgi:hypothetical protein
MAEQFYVRPVHLKTPNFPKHFWIENSEGFHPEQNSPLFHAGTEAIR